MTDTSQAILVTGGSRGIGASLAGRAAQEGYDVCFSYHSRFQEAEETCAEIRRAGQRALAVQVDLGVEGDIVELWEEAIENFGTISALVNNVGVLDEQKPLADYDADRVRRILNVNVFGSILCAREAVTHMSTARGGEGGVIVNVSSVAARLGSPGEYVDYAASKGAIDTMTVGLAKEVADQDIRVNAVRPGTIDTDIHETGGEPDRVDRVAESIPVGRAGRPAEVADAILWLVSDRASYATGAILDVTGGL